MKLFFPNGEHATVDVLGDTLIIGSSAACQVVLAAAGIAPRHCEIRQQGGRAQVVPLAMTAPTTLNGAAVTGPTDIRGGDLLNIATVSCRVVATERKVAVPSGAGSKPAPADDNGSTRLRMALPKYVLRGVSGSTFGKVFPVHGSMVVGRSSDCNICIASEEISRHHARLQLVPEGVMVEDTGSANGTYVNDQRVVGQTLLKPGGELRMDVVRFQLIAPGKETEQVPAAATRARAPATAAPKPSTTWLWIVLGLVVLAAAAFYAIYSGLVHI